ncbi:hypothetical protein CWB98_17325 [Pseudoalteromonas rubra]|uniref:Uncharacterized protein n=1 Tax=Pseudoalteromonas rubra TaxID=43658 RepID=A0A5S3WW12_9GAMM|nr:hypothetical protein CWB98_17325 [Pseudoalteromonas rubra]
MLILETIERLAVTTLGHSSKDAVFQPELVIYNRRQMQGNEENQCIACVDVDGCHQDGKV